MLQYLLLRKNLFLKNKNSVRNDVLWNPIYIQNKKHLNKRRMFIRFLRYSGLITVKK